jgi:hypothetical protein
MNLLVERERIPEPPNAANVVGSAAQHLEARLQVTSGLERRLDLVCALDPLQGTVGGWRQSRPSS